MTTRIELRLDVATGEEGNGGDLAGFIAKLAAEVQDGGDDGYYCLRDRYDRIVGECRITPKVKG